MLVYEYMENKSLDNFIFGTEHPDNCLNIFGAILIHCR
jgi:hypothetical protein